MKVFKSKPQEYNNEMILILLDKNKQPLTLAEREVLFTRHAPLFSTETLGVLAKHESPGETKYSNARIIFSNKSLVQTFSEKEILDISSFNRPLCQIVLSSDTINQQESLKKTLEKILEDLRHQERVLMPAAQMRP